MKIKRMTTAALALSLAAAMLAGCSKDEPKNNANSSQPDLFAYHGEEDTRVAVEEPDFVGFLTGTSETNFYDMSFEEFVEATNGQCTAENATSYNLDNSGVVRYYFGKKDSMVGGRLKLPKETDIECELTFKKNKLKCMTVKAEGFTEEEATKLCDDFLAALDGKLPEGYKPFDPVGPMSGSSCEIGYSKGVDDYIVSLKRKYFSGDYSVEFILEVYSERYNFD